MRPPWYDLPKVWEGSRWLGYKAGELCVWAVKWIDGEGERENYTCTGYLLQQEETLEFKRITDEKMQQLIAEKRLICIYNYTKAQWLAMSKN